MYVDIRKTVTSVATIVCLTVLAVKGVVDSTVVVGAITTIAGIAIGNGKNAIKGIISAPMVVPKSAVQNTLEKESEYGDFKESSG